MFKKIIFYWRVLWHSLFFGMKNVDNILTTSQKNNDSSGAEINIRKETNGGVFNDLLEQKVTQEVEELRYSSYVVAQESKKYKYVGDIGNGYAVKKTESELKEKHINIDESDNLPIILIQDTEKICKSVIETLNGENNKYTLKIDRKLYPRFLIENYIRKIVVKQAEEKYVIDLYCSKYPRQFKERIDKPFLREINNIKEGIIRNSDILEFNEISFITFNAWGVDDWTKFTFIDFEFYKIIEFDGNYIIRLGCLSKNFMENILDKVFSQTAKEKYSKKEQKSNKILQIDTLYKKNNEIQTTFDIKNLNNYKFSIENEE